MGIVDRIKELAEEKGLTIAELEEYLSLEKNSISNWDTLNPRSDKVETVAKYFNVSFNYLIGKTPDREHYVSLQGPGYCPQCGFGPMVPSVPWDVRMHNNRHKKYLAAKEKFGDLIGNYATREDIKAEARQILADDNKSSDEKYAAFLTEQFCLFSRSVQATRWSLDHVDFPTYLAMILNQKFTKEKLPPEVYKRAVSKFGTQEGIENGKTYYFIPKKTKKNPKTKAKTKAKVK